MKVFKRQGCTKKVNKKDIFLMLSIYIIKCQLFLTSRLLNGTGEILLCIIHLVLLKLGYLYSPNKISNSNTDLDYYHNH